MDYWIVPPKDLADTCVRAGYRVLYEWLCLLVAALLKPSTCARSDEAESQYVGSSGISGYPVDVAEFNVWPCVCTV